jgi:hypothetical protein
MKQRHHKTQHATVFWCKTTSLASLPQLLLQLSWAYSQVSFMQQNSSKDSGTPTQCLQMLLASIGAWDSQTQLYDTACGLLLKKTCCSTKQKLTLPKPKES